MLIFDPKTTYLVLYPSYGNLTTRIAIIDTNWVLYVFSTFFFQGASRPLKKSFVWKKKKKRLPNRRNLIDAKRFPKRPEVDCRNCWIEKGRKFCSNWKGKSLLFLRQGGLSNFRFLLFFGLVFVISF
jgi:hypothetical protein